MEAIKMPDIINFEKTSGTAKKVMEITSFAGIDLSSAPTDISSKRSPEAPNMMPDSKGNPIKRTGFSVVEKYGGRINGAFFLGGHRIIHAGTGLFIDGAEAWSGMADEISTGQIIGDKLFIFDGLEALCFDGNEVAPLEDMAYIPTVLISKNADSAEKETVLKGDGVSTEFGLDEEPEEICSVEIDETSTEYGFFDGKITFEDAPEEGAEIVIKARYAMEPAGSLKEEFNLISPRWKESFLCSTGTEKDFTLSKTGLCAAPVRAWVMDEKGEWQEKNENTDFTVDRENGKITFSEPIPKTPVTGEDNLIIEAEKFFDGYRERINGCRRSIAFDSGGTASRLFICGNPEEPNRDYWCAANDPTYWPDVYYSELGNSGVSIIGYSIIGDYLAAHISPAFDGRSIVFRKADVDESGNAVFPVAGHLLGEEAVAPHSFVYMEKEPLFLTARGVYAVTEQDVSGEKYTQNRSFFINKALCRENLAEAFCAKWKQFYLISAGGRLWLMDTSQKSYERGEPLSTFQYECYLWEGFDARILWEEDGSLFFGDGEGRICRFTENSYSDEGKAIEAYWTFPDFSGGDFWRKKTIRTAAVQAAAYPLNRLRLECRKDGKWKVLKEWTDKISFFSWGALSWKDFTWSGNSKTRTLTVKTKIKQFDRAGFRIVCDEKDKAFGLYGFALEYTEGGRYKK